MDRTYEKQNGLQSGERRRRREKEKHASDESMMRAESMMRGEKVESQVTEGNMRGV